VDVAASDDNAAAGDHILNGNATNKVLDKFFDIAGYDVS